MRRRFIFGGFTFLMIFMVAGCWSQTEEADVEMDRLTWEHEIQDKAYYAHDLWFENHLVWGQRDWRRFYHIYSRRDTEITEIIFVHSEEEAQAFGMPHDVIIAWPSLISQGIVGVINDSDIDLEAFGLTAPLTIEDLVDNWEKVEILYHGLPMGEWGMIVEQAQAIYGREFNHNWWVRRWLFPRRLDRFNSLLEGRDINEVDLTRFNERYNLELTVEDLPTQPITEEDVHYNPQLVFEIAFQLLTDEERHSIDPENLIRAQHEAEDESKE